MSIKPNIENEPKFLYIPPGNQDTKKSSLGANLDALRGTERIMFIDDKPELVTVTTAMLRHLGYEVTGFESAKKAVQHFVDNNQSFDLIITDRTMPEIDGIAAIHAFKKIRPSIRIIMCSGLTENVSTQELTELGCTGLISKPFTLPQLGETVRKVLDQQG